MCKNIWIRKRLMYNFELFTATSGKVNHQEWHSLAYHHLRRSVSIQIEFTTPHPSAARDFLFPL